MEMPQGRGTEVFYPHPFHVVSLTLQPSNRLIKGKFFLLFPELFHGLKDLEEVKSTLYFAWVVMLTRLLRKQNLSQVILCLLSIQHDRRQEPTKITGLSDKMYLLCKNGKHSLQLWQSISLTTRSFLIENPITSCRNLGRKVSKLDL